MRTVLLSTLTILAFSACSSTEETKKDNTTLTAKEAVKSITDTNKKDYAVKPKSGEVLYNTKCASCHGRNGKVSALNASKQIAGWSSEKTEKILNGYKTGTSGRSMKAIMQAQVKPLSKEEIKRISDYIATL